MYRDDLIRARRAAKKWTQEQTAKKSGVNINTYRAIENGKATVEIITLSKVASTLGLPMSSLFDSTSIVSRAA